MRFAAIVAAALIILTPLRAGAAEHAIVLPAPFYDPPTSREGAQKLVVAGGCFWGVQGVFQRVKGVSRAISGYAGGARETAHYDKVSQGDAGHAESVEITYDPRKVSLGELLRVYFSVAHDPTQLNRQGPDIGAQYRSAIFVANAEEEKVARDYISQLADAKVFSAPIVTTLEPLKAFYPAEAYHQDYLVRHPTQPYIVYNDLPKIDNLKRLFPSLYRESPALTN
ncbi:peptide-methionine (S)-S-oxide reductase MsrA [Methylocystis sp.]|uniref:peptide-methionine (S)-S-oxide reductase MsrA n=1 Tax=Methylocystis sp. TaxID=1911079 RepID=UPI003D0BC724